MAINVSPNIVSNGLVFAYDMTNTVKSWKGKPTTNFISNPTEEMARGEFGQYRDLAPIFNTNGLVPYSLSMDIKVNKPGSVSVYMQNGSTTKYSFVSDSVSATTEYQRFYFNNLTPAISNAADTVAMLATYTGYGSGVNPTVRNIQLELGTFATPFVDGTRSTSQSLIDATHNSTIVANSLVYNANGTHSFDGTSSYATMSTGLSGGGVLTPFTLEAVAKTATGSGWQTVVGTHGTYRQIGFMNTYFYYGGNAGGGNSFVSGGTVAANTPYHMVFTWDGTTAYGYLNNAQTTGSIGGNGGTISNNSIGSYSSSGAGEPLNGTIYLVRIYNRALTANEVAQNYNAMRSRYGI